MDALNEFEFLGANGTKGGILMAWNQSKFQRIDEYIGAYSVSVILKHKEECFQVTAVYGPSNYQVRRQFFQELQHIKPQDDMPWLLCGDSNVTLTREERSNPNSRNWRESVSLLIFY